MVTEYDLSQEKSRGTKNNELLTLIHMYFDRGFRGRGHRKQSVIEPFVTKSVIRKRRQFIYTLYKVFFFFSTDDDRICFFPEMSSCLLKINSIRFSYVSENCQSRGFCYLPKLKADVDNISLPSDNSRTTVSFIR